REFVIVGHNDKTIHQHWVYAPDLGRAELAETVDFDEIEKGETQTYKSGKLVEFSHKPNIRKKTGKLKPKSESAKLLSKPSKKLLKCSDDPLRRSKRLRDQVDKNSSPENSKIQISEATPQDIYLAKDKTILKPEKHPENEESNQDEMTDIEDFKQDFKSLEQSNTAALPEKSRIDTLAQDDETILPEEITDIH
ncbi:hypothetical protein GcC1_214036, partial [Golovinomyces cichoracearum]